MGSEPDEKREDAWEEERALQVSVRIGDFTVEGDRGAGGVPKAVADAKGGKTSSSQVNIDREGLLSAQAAEGVSYYILCYCCARGKRDPFYPEPSVGS